MIEGCVSIERSTAYFTGENVRCSVRFTNNGNDKKTLMWATVQLVCHVAFHDSYVCFPPDSPLYNSTSFFNPSLKPVNQTITSLQPPPVPVLKGRQVFTVFSSPIDILVCDLSLDSGQSETFTYASQIPETGPSTYRGVAVKYSYCLLVNAQVSNQPTQAIPIYIKVFQFQSLPHLHHSESLPNERRSHGLYNPDSGGQIEFSQVTCRDRFFSKAIEGAKRRIERMELAERERERMKLLRHANSRQEDEAILKAMVQRLASLTLRHHGTNFLHTYRIGNKDRTVCMFTLFKPTYRLGEEITAQFDFEGCNLPCHQISATLESSEEIENEFRPPGVKSLLQPKVHSEFSEYCRYTNRTYLNLTIPLTATPEFSTPYVSLKWYLRFEFIAEYAPSKPLLDEPGSLFSLRSENGQDMNIRRLFTPSSMAEDIITNAPDSVKVQPLVWRLPITILPTNPINLPKSTQDSYLNL